MSTNHYVYNAELVRVIDGDTVRFKLSKEFDFGFHIKHNSVYEGNFRLFGINTPEIRGEERPEGLRSKAIVEDILTQAKEIKVKTYKPDKYGRWLADIYVVNSHNSQVYLLNQYLVDNGYAEPYLI